jgi:cytochrome c oxidase subunit II
LPLRSSSSGGSLSTSSCLCREAQLANPLRQPLPDGIVPEQVVARTENRWLFIMAGMLVVLMAIIVVTGSVYALHPPSNIEIIDPVTLHLKGEFVESNLGSAVEPDGSVTVRVLAEQYGFVPNCIRVPVDTPIKFRLTSADVIHGFLIPNTNVNTMVVPGYVAEVRTRFTATGRNAMPCHEYCGLGHQAMWAHVVVVPKGEFANFTPTTRFSCERQ